MKTVKLVMFLVICVVLASCTKEQAVQTDSNSQPVLVKITAVYNDGTSQVFPTVVGPK